jgi:hypothetical protein
MEMSPQISKGLCLQLRFNSSHSENEWPHSSGHRMPGQESLVVSEKTGIFNNVLCVA